MANRTRDIPIQFFVTSEEKKMIEKNDLIKNRKHGSLSS